MHGLVDAKYLESPSSSLPPLITTNSRLTALTHRLRCRRTNTSASPDRNLLPRGAVVMVKVK
jgi:hypothetical protein